MAQKITLLNVSIVDLYPQEKEFFNLSDDFQRLIISENTPDLIEDKFFSTYLSPSIVPSGSYFIYADRNQIIDMKEKQTNSLSGPLFDLTFRIDAEIRKIGYDELAPKVVTFTVGQINDAASNGVIGLCSQNTPYIKKIGMVFK